jgi:hypothetical protein
MHAEIPLIFFNKVSKLKTVSAECKASHALITSLSHCTGKQSLQQTEKLILMEIQAQQS